MHASTRILPNTRDDHDANSVNKPDLRLLDLIVALCTWQGKAYCFPKQDTLCRLFLQRYGVKISRRTLNRHLRALTLGGYIRRQVRHQKHRLHGWMFRSTLYLIGPRTVQRLGRIGTQCAKFMKTALKSAPSIRVTKMANKLVNLYESVLPAPQIRGAPGG